MSGIPEATADEICLLERFPTLSSRLSSSENALALCFGEHLYPTDDLVWSDDALDAVGGSQEHGGDSAAEAAEYGNQANAEECSNDAVFQGGDATSVQMQPAPGDKDFHQVGPSV
jgi:hypothetical protein